MASEQSAIQALASRAASWSDDTFGTGRPPHGAIAHLRREVAELGETPYDREEYADCLLLLLDAHRKAGGSADDLVAAAADGVVEHVR